MKKAILIGNLPFAAIFESAVLWYNQAVNMIKMSGGDMA